MKNTKAGGQGGVHTTKGKPQKPLQKPAKKYGDDVFTAVYKVNKSEVLLEFLLRKCNTSRNNVKAFLSRRQVLVNGSVVTQFDFPLAKDDEVKLAKKSVQGNVMPAKARVEKKVRRKPTAPVQVKIIYEDDDFIAVDKPVGLLSVESDTESECAFAHVFEYLQENSKTARPYILHRIDKETSGVLVFAKNPKVYSALKLHWNEYVILREYYAVAEGVMENKTDTITSYLKENTNNLVYVTQDKTAQKAVTQYKVVRENAQYSLLQVQIETGKKNQIRVQLKSIGHGIVGDEKYGFTKNPLGRLGLHASKLIFLHPFTKEEIQISAGVPASFRALFQNA